MTKGNTKRFSNRVEEYIKFRPSYPTEIIKILEDAFAFNQTNIVADIGSGTGISSTPFLKNGNVVSGI